MIVVCKQADEGISTLLLLLLLPAGLHITESWSGFRNRGWGEAWQPRACCTERRVIGGGASAVDSKAHSNVHHNEAKGTAASGVHKADHTRGTG